MPAGKRLNSSEGRQKGSSANRGLEGHLVCSLKWFTKCEGLAGSEDVKQTGSRSRKALDFLKKDLGLYSEGDSHQRMSKTVGSIT